MSHVTEKISLKKLSKIENKKDFDFELEVGTRSEIQIPDFCSTFAVLLQYFCSTFAVFCSTFAVFCSTFADSLKLDSLIL